MTKEFSRADWLRIITSGTITAQQIALVEDCDIKTARRMVVELNGNSHTKNTAYRCDTDAYLAKYRGTSREQELRLVFERTRV